MTTGPVTGQTPEPEPVVVNAEPFRTWRPTTAGILIIISGAISIISGIALAAFAGAAGPVLRFYGVAPISTVPFIAGGIILLLKGIVEVVGGAYALRRKVWGLALAASILALFPSLVLGVLSIIFISMSKREFDECCS